MSEQRPSDVLGALPRRRPQRRSAKRPAPAATRNPTNETEASAPTPDKPKSRKRATRSTAKAAPATKAAPAPTPTTARRRPQRLRQPAQPAGVPPTPREQRPDDASDRHILGTAAQAAAELAEIGMSLSARALRRVVDRLPRP